MSGTAGDAFPSEPDAADGPVESGDDPVGHDHDALVPEPEPEAVPWADYEEVARERDEFKDLLLRVQADFDNFRKRTLKQQTELIDRAAEKLVEQLFPVLDAFDLALQHHADDETVKQLAGVLWGALEREGLERIDPIGQPFDPEVHEAVAHEPATDAAAGPVVVGVMRPGYRWKGRVVRTAMVSVRG